MSLNEIVDRQSKIISMQSEIINDLFQLLGQHLAADELDNLPAVRKINMAAAIREEIDGV